MTERFKVNLLIISGRSGAGKSVCLNLLEDLGYYCIDNLPVHLLPNLIENIKVKSSHIAVSIDARNIDLDTIYLSELINRLKQCGAHCLLAYFDARDDILLNRFNETRRKHPLTSHTVSLEEALRNEQRILANISEFADLRIDTSQLTVQQLRALVKQRIAHKKLDELYLFFESFGYKFGIPPDADFIFDARCLPNPYWQANLRGLTGLDAEVGRFLELQAKPLLDAMIQFLEPTLEWFRKSDRIYLTVAIGCTGGQHRSVYLVEQLAKYFHKIYPNVQVRHRNV
jgi:RNase adapter protein RapZ